jgi:adenylate kinase family enzyme
MELLKDAMTSSPDDSPGFLIDGFPRELNQAIAFEQSVNKLELLY